MATVVRFALSVLLACALVACGGGGTSAVTPTPPSGGNTKSYSLSGRIQKGPFGIGSQISVNALDTSLNPTGAVFNTQTSDALGDFAVSSKIKTPMVEIVAQGFYFDELSGVLSASQIQLRAISNISSNGNPTVNVLTTLQEQRLKELMTNGKSFAAACTESEAEVLSLFEIDASKVPSLSTFDSLRIDHNSEADGVLLAISALMAQIATDKAQANGTTQAAELSNLVNTIAAGITNTGTFTSSAFVTERNKAAAEIVSGTIIGNLQNYYAGNGVTIATPNFIEWVDQNESGVLPQQQDNEYAYVSNAGSNQIWEYQLNKASGILVNFGTAATGNNPQGIVATHSGKYLYASNSSDGTISEYAVDSVTHALSSIGTAPAGTFPGIPAIDPTDSFLYVPDQSGDVVLEYTIDSATGKLTANGNISAGTGPWSLTVDPSGKYAYVPDGSSVLVYGIDISTGTLSSLGSATADSGAVAVAITPDDKYAFSSDNQAGHITGFSLDSSSGALTSLGNTNTGTLSNGLAIDLTGAFLYIADGGPDDIEEYSIDDSAGSLSSIGSMGNTGTGIEAVSAEPSGKFIVAGILGPIGEAQVAVYSDLASKNGTSGKVVN